MSDMEIEMFKKTLYDVRLLDGDREFADDPNYRGSVVMPLTSKKRAVAIAEVAAKVAPDGCRVVVSLAGSKKLIEFN